MDADTPMWRQPGLRRLVVVTILTFTSFGLTLSALPSWAVHGGVAIGIVGSVTTAMLLCTIAVQLLVPFLVDRFGIGRPLWIGLVLLGAPAPCYLLSQELWWLVVVSIVRGAGFGILTVLGSTLAVTLAPAHRRGEAVGLYGLAVAVPTMVAVPVGVVLVLAGKFAWVAGCAALPLAGLGVVRMLTPERPPPAAKAPPALSHDALGALRPSLALFLVTFSGAGLLTFLPTVPVGSAAVLAVWLFSVSSALARWRVGTLADRIGGRRLLVGSVVVAGLGLSCVAAAVAGWLPGPAMAVGSLTFGAGYGAAQNLTLLEAVARTQRHDVASAIWNMGFDAGTAMGALVTGLLAATALGVPGAFAVAGAATAAGAVLLRRRATRDATGHAGSRKAPEASGDSIAP